MNYQQMTLAELEDARDVWYEQLGDTVSQHRAECALAGDSWPGACQEIARLEDCVQAVEAEIARRAS